MVLIKWVLYFFATVYGSFMVLGGLTQVKKKKIYLWSAISMIIAGLVIVVAPFIIFQSNFTGIMLLIVSLLIIHISAISNGIKMHGKINVIHHGFRLLISVCIVTLYLIAK